MVSNATVRSAESADSEQNSNSGSNTPDFHGACVVDAQGHEVEITEDMVRKAIHELDHEAYPDVED